MNTVLKVLALFAHPDDAEFLCAGTLASLADHGARIHIATMTAGDCGSTVLSAAEVSRTRRKEAANAARLIDAEYLCVGEKDLSIFYDERTLKKATEVLRQVDPALVFTNAPVDYMADHEITSRLCQTACFSSMAPNYKTDVRRAAKSLSHIPHLYYVQPAGDRDILGQEIPPTLVVDITSTMERKEKMLSCHKSQIEWLRAQQKIQDFLGMMRRTAKRAGKLVGVKWAEGFRQHLGQGFPQDNLLEELLGDLVHRG